MIGFFPIINIDINHFFPIYFRFYFWAFAGLKKRGTDSDRRIEIRLERFEEEMNLKNEFDEIMINEDLESAKLELINIIKKLKKGE